MTLELKKEFQKINDKLDELNEIEIKNGGGRSVKYERQDFFQMLYDRGKERFNSFSKISHQTMEIIKLVGALAMIIYVIVNTIK